jgi:four helix bundle protein
MSYSLCMGHYQQLRVWQLAHRLAIDIRRTTQTFPSEEKYDLTSQIRRASLSVPTNIAEGQARFGRGGTLYFTRVAFSSLAEVEYLLFYAFDYGCLEKYAYDRLEDQRKHVNVLLIRLIRSLDSGD